MKTLNIISILSFFLIQFSFAADLLPLECDVTYKSADMAPAECNFRPTQYNKCRHNGVSSDQRFEFIGEYDESQHLCPDFVGAPMNVYKEQYSDKVSFYSKPTEFNNVIPANRALKFNIDHSGRLTIVSTRLNHFSIVDSKDVVYDFKPVKQDNPADTCSIYLKNIGDCYIYNHSIEDAGIWGISFKNCSEVELPEELNAALVTCNEDIQINCCDAIDNVYVYDYSGNVIEQHNLSSLSSSEDILKISLNTKLSEYSKIKVRNSHSQKTWTK